MQNLGVNEIREKYLEFFESKGHLRLPSFPLVPKNDASLLLINSGMAPMKAWFTGAEVPPRKRVTTCQKCIRTPDIEQVGKTARHGTFFEMLGNFSFGDYFKHEIIPWAWEFLTEVMQIPKEVLWVTVYEDDDEARDIWINEVGVPADRVVKMGKEDNFWEHGTGPCGPCSEIHVDRGEKYGCGKPDCKIGCECDRFMEVWNLVFTQFDRAEDGTYSRLSHPNIDTGMGLERLAVVMQGVDNLFEVDTVQNVMKHIQRYAGVEYKKGDAAVDVSLRVITDHIRSTVMMVSDGVIPSNEGRGYVLRRLLRRAARHGRLLGIDGAFLYDVADTVIDESKLGYPELDEKRGYIKKIIKIEEEKFDKTIEGGLVVLNQYISDAKTGGLKKLSGEQAFKLHDTYGFPLDLTIEIAEENGLGVDVEGFNAAMKEQKDTARAARKDGSSWDADTVYEFEDASATVFEGYTTLTCEGTVVGIAAEGEVSSKITEGESGIIVADKTPFYAEMGGQAGDIGEIVSRGGTAEVTYTKKTGDGLYLHEVTVKSGEFNLGDGVTLTVDRKNRMNIARNHSATHLLHKALREALGDHVAQAGSYVGADRLRFDFSHFEAMTAEQIKAVEDRVNEAILDALPIEVRELPIDEAKKLGATAQFGEKYGDIVRVVSMGEFSMEFCGGTHLKNTSECGLFKILSESGIAAGVRRIEAVTGRGVLDYIGERDRLAAGVAAALKINQINEIDKKAESVAAYIKELEKRVEKFKERAAAAKVSNIMAGIKHIGEINLLTAQVDGMGIDEMKTMADKIKAEIPCSVAVMAANTDGKITFVAMASKDAVKLGVHCGNIIKEVTAAAGGRGGGKPDMAQGGGTDASKIDDALAKVDDLIIAQVG